jgi:hypothetical protein
VTPLPLLDDLHIASPCPASWDDMEGDDRARHCGLCDQTVYDLSGLTAAQARALLRRKGGGVCVRLFRRADGTVLTADCPVGLGGRLATPARARGWIWGLLAAAAALLGGVVCFGVRPFQQGPPEASSRGRQLMGKVCPVGGPAVDVPGPAPPVPPAPGGA